MTHDAIRRFAHALILLATFAVFAPAYAGNADIFWIYETTGGYLDSSPAITDLDGDGSPDICVTSTSGSVFALDAFGREIWTVDLTEQITIAPTAFDVSGDSAPELLVMTQAGKLYCLEGRSGNVIWVYDLPSGTKLDRVTSYTLEYRENGPIKYGGTALVAADMDGDGVVEIVANMVSGTAICLDAWGNLLWSHDVGGDLQTTPAVGDLDGDGMAEVVISTLDHPAICLSADGTLRWQYDADAGSRLRTWMATV